MSSRLGWILAAAGAGLLAAGMARSGGAGAAQLEAPAAERSLGEHDFGELVGELVRRHEFRILNPGPEAWHVRTTWEDCGCVAIESTTDRVEVGEELVLRVRIDTRGQAAGPLEKRVYALVEPGPVRLAATLRARILPAAHAQPSFLEVEVARGTQAFTAEGAIRCARLGGTPRLDLEHPAPELEVEILPPAPGGELALFPVRIRGQLPAEQAARSWDLVFRVSAPGRDAEVAGLTVLVRRARELEVSPRELVLDLRRGPAEGLVFVRESGGEPPRELACRLEPADAGQVSYDAERGLVRVLADPPPEASPELCLVLSAGETVRVPLRLRRGD